MSVDDLDLEKFAKVLQLTDSSHDGEVLNSIKLANQMLKKAGLTFQDIVARREADTSVTAMRTEFLRRMHQLVQKHQAEQETMKEEHRKEVDYLNRRIVWWREKSAHLNDESHQEEILKLNRKVDWWRHKYQYLLERAEQEKAELAATMTKRINYWKSKANGSLLGFQSKNPAA
ncbi:MAG: hypothetical protein HQL66_07055 [Magnetococcales bacterium]|nr:hypothetical protein [Magnetococcales bacterium]